jgi:uncharacterized membrane protein YbhN (UPF0104 family)
VTNVQLAGFPAAPWPSWQAWHVALALGVVCLIGYWLARLQRSRAREDFADAYFYSPSQKVKQRERRERWERICLVLLITTGVCLVAALVLYFL